MARKEELEEVFKDINENAKKLINPLIDEVIFLEKKMAELKILPFVKVHPIDKTKQKTTPAAKQYKECSQSYMNAIRILSSFINKEDKEESPLEQYLEGLKNKYE